MQSTPEAGEAAGQQYENEGSDLLTRRCTGCNQGLCPRPEYPLREVFAWQSFVTNSSSPVRRRRSVSTHALPDAPFREPYETPVGLRAELPHLPFLGRLRRQHELDDH
jgi:hypothetical protein